MAKPLPDGQKLCPIHDVTYGKLERCPACRANAGIAVTTGSPKADTKELELREGEYREADKFLRRVAKEWIETGTAQERNAALKAFDAASKWARLSLEIRTTRLEIEHDQWLRDENMKMRGNGN